MHYLTILILGTAAGIAGYAGIIHGFIGVARRPRDLTHLLFALLSLSVASHTLAVVVMQRTTNLTDYLFIHKYFFGPTALAVFVCFMWFVACYTNVWPRRFLAAMSLWIALSIALHVLLPFGLLYSHISGLNQISLSWGEQIVSARGTPNPLRLSFDLFNLVLFIFCFSALVRQYRAGNRRRALMLGLALAVFLLSRVIDSLIGLGVIHAMRVSEVAFVGIVVTMSLTLSYEVTQTEQQLHRYQEQLYELVAARTAELTDTNTQLAQEIRERTLLDAALERRVSQLAALKQIADIGIRMTDLAGALQRMSEITATLFDARLTLLLLPPTQALERPTLVGFDRSTGALEPTPVDVALADLPRSTQVLTEGRSLLLPPVQVCSLPPSIQAFLPAPTLHSTMLIPLSIPGAVIGVMCVATDQPERMFSADELNLAETIATDISAAINNTRLYQRALAARERLTALYQAAQAISRASLNPQQIYAEIHCALAGLMPTERLVVALYDQPNQAVEYVYLADAAGRVLGKRAPLASSFADYLLRQPGSVRIDDCSALPHAVAPVEGFGDRSEAASGVAALLRGSEHELGMLLVQSYAKGAYTDEDEELLKLLAAHAAIALENAQHYAQARDLAMREERTRLARELHDSVTQNLYAATLVIETVPVIWSRNAAEGAHNLAKVRQLVRGALAEMRTLLFELRPAALAAAELATLLRQLGEVLTGHTRIPVEVHIEGSVSLPVDVKIAIYRIAQEAFNNIAKHAGATQVRVVLRALCEGGVCLVVRDDGCGFDPRSTPADRMGLRIMAERTSGIGARLWVNSAPQHGTEVTVQWPEQPLAAGPQADARDGLFQETFRVNT